MPSQKHYSLVKGKKRLPAISRDTCGKLREGMRKNSPPKLG